MEPRGFRTLDLSPESIAERLKPYGGKHPRLYLDEESLGGVRLVRDTTHSGLWDGVRKAADNLLLNTQPEYHDPDTPIDPRHPWGPYEQLWQREVGNTIALLTAAYAFSCEEKYYEKAKEWVLASCSYPHWGLGNFDCNDLAAAHQLYGIGLFYDWCYDVIDEDTKAIIRATVAERSPKLYSSYNGGCQSQEYLQNHLWVNVTSLTAAALALFEELPDASRWISLGLEKINITMASLSDDGSSLEGVGYWQYGVEYLLKYMYLVRDMLDVDFFDSPWWKATSMYPLYLTVPRDSWTRRCVNVDIADCSRYNWYGPGHLLRALAKEYRDGHAQWLADAMDEAGVGGDVNAGSWLNMLWYDPSVEPAPPDDLPTIHHFTDMGIVSARSDWSGAESLVVFKCGPLLGHYANSIYDFAPSGGHAHHDYNHFILFANGEWLMRDDGYALKVIGEHNTLVIDGGDEYGGERYKGAAVGLADQLQSQNVPRIRRVVPGDAVDYMVGDATYAYPGGLGVRKFLRHLLFVKPNVLIVVDDIELDSVHDLELRFHLEQKEAIDLGNGLFQVQGKKTLLDIRSLTPDGVDFSCELMSNPGVRGTKRGPEMLTVCTRTSDRTWRNATALSWGGNQSDLRLVTLEQHGDRWSFQIDSRVIELDLSGDLHSAPIAYAR